MKEKFQLADRVNAEKRLKFGHKALLNQVISFQLGNQKIYATDKWLAEHWGESIQVIKKIIRELKKRGLIFCELIRRKHTEGGNNWYNKRYITVDFQMLEAFLGGEDTAVTKSEMKDRILTDEEAESISKMEDSYFGGNYPIEDNEYASMFYGKVSDTEIQETLIQTLSAKPSALDFDTLRIIEMITKHGGLLAELLQKFPNFVDSIESGKYNEMEIQYLKEFHQAILLDEKLKNEYRGIQHEKNKEVLA